MTQDKKYLFDANVFDAPPKEDIAEFTPPPPPVFSEDDLSVAKDVAFERGRQQGRREETESRDQIVAAMLGTIAEGLSHLLAAETLRENIFEKESVRLALHSLDLLFPLLNEKLGHEEVLSVIAKTIADHKKTKEISITVPAGLKTEIDAMLARLRDGETDEVWWKVTENASLSPSDCALEWSDGGAVRDSLRAARDIRKNLEGMLNETHAVAVPEDSHSADAPSVVSYETTSESGAEVKTETGT